MYLSTVSEPLDKLVRFGQTLEFFDVASVGQRVFYESLGEDLEEGGLPRTLERLRAVLRERHPGILIIDSFKALAAYAATHRDFRSFLFQLAADTSAVAGSSFWLGEYDLDTISGEPEAAVADSIIGLGYRRSGERSSRVLEVIKLRGSNYLSGQHSYRISAAGLSVFPRLADTVDSSELRPRCRARVDGHRGARRDAHRRLLAGIVDAVRRSIGHRKDADGTALHRRRRCRRRAWDHREPPGKSDPAHARRASVRLDAR